MIQVTVKRQGEDILGLKVTGHAGFAEKGKDLVCAGVSSVGFGLCNAFDEMHCDGEATAVGNVVEIKVKKPDVISNTILETGVIQLKTIQETSGSFVRIKEEQS